MSQTKDHSWHAYFVVFNALLLLTVITVALSYYDVGEILSQGSLWGAQMTYDIKWLPTLPVVEIGHAANIVLGLIVAMIKASLVVWYFMHMDHEEGNNRFILGFSISLLLLAFTAFSFDFVWLGTYAHSFAAAALGGS
jgi:caa(3)-type oxidase subunit IV